MRATFKAISLTIILLLSSGSLFAHAHLPQPAPSYWGGIPICPNPYTHSSICHTYSGQACSLYISYYQPSWFSACLSSGFFHACLNAPAFPAPLVQNACYLRGTPCVCSFGLINGYYYYEPGFVN